MSVSYKNLESPVEFKLEGVFSRGVVKDEFKSDGYSIPVTLDEEDASRISDLAEENSAKSPVYNGKTIYLKVKCLTVKQKAELLGKGTMSILVHFRFTGVYTRDDINYLIHKVTKLRKLEKTEEEDIPED